ncbi:glycosyltransferase [Psychrobacter immobilis]|uniref:glycosyltransferase n=1 Tax=Psychrobacter immobilis TaxID=498 RepID=UPI00191A01F3|nr:glycosyltransferase [Psychrobacter immobilis]
MKFSLLMSVYQYDDAKFFEQALRSIEVNSVKPTDFVLVCDGALTPELDEIIEDYTNRLLINVIRLPHNVGLGRALQTGINYCQYEWVARFDSDDICISDRFAKQVTYIKDNSNVDVVGGQIIEFANDPNEGSARKKIVPTSHHQIDKYAKSRNPINHMTVMFKKSAVLEAGNYQHAPLYEDYDLWVRMLMKGFKFANIDDVLVYVRAGDNMYRRRGGVSYAKRETVMQYSFYKLGFLSCLQLVKNLTLRIPIRLIPSSIRGLIYSKVLRQ